MPVFNCQPYLSDAIDSILKQSFKDFELIIINDGSTDETLNIAKRFSRTDNRISIIDTPNQGVVAAINTGLNYAQGEIIARMDGDDICLPDRFQKQVDYLARNNDVVAVGGQILLIDPQGRKLDILPLPTKHKKIDAAHMAGITAMTHPAVMFRSAALAKVLGYRKEVIHAEDIDLWLQLAEVGHLANLDDVILLYRQHQTSIGYTKRKEQVLSCWRAAQDAATRRHQVFDMPPPNKTLLTPKDDIYLRWGWWAYQGGHIATARYYAIKRISQNPLRVDAWRLMYCAFLKKPFTHK